jgi:hypothetical protein
MASSAPAHASSLAEEHLKNVLRVSPSAHPSIEVLDIGSLVVSVLFLGVAQDSVGFSDVFKRLFGLCSHLFVGVMSVGMPFQGHFLVGLLDVGLVSGFRDV